MPAPRGSKFQHKCCFCLNRHLEGNFEGFTLINQLSANCWLGLAVKTCSEKRFPLPIEPGSFYPKAIQTTNEGLRPEASIILGIISSLQEAGPKLATTWRSVVNPASNIQPGRESTKMGIKCFVGSGHICVFFFLGSFSGWQKESKRSTTICCQNLQASLHFFLPTQRRLIKWPKVMFETSKRVFPPFLRLFGLLNLA